MDRIVHVTRLPHVEGTCPHGTSFLLGDGLLGDAHLVIDVVNGVGEYLGRFYWVSRVGLVTLHE